MTDHKCRQLCIAAYTRAAEEDTVEQLNDLLSSAEEPSTSYGTIPVFHQKVGICERCESHQSGHDSKCFLH